FGDKEAQSKRLDQGEKAQEQWRCFKVFQRGDRRFDDANGYLTCRTDHELSSSSPADLIQQPWPSSPGPATQAPTFTCVWGLGLSVNPGSLFRPRRGVPGGYSPATTPARLR